MPWPKELPEQVRLVAQALAEAHAPLTEDAIAARFQGRGPCKKRLPQILDTLIAVGRVRMVAGSKGHVSKYMFLLIFFSFHADSAKLSDQRRSGCLFLNAYKLSFNPLLKAYSRS